MSSPSFFPLLSIFIQGNGGCSGVSNEARDVLLASMGGMPVRAKRQKAHRPALANANVYLLRLLLLFFLFLSIFVQGNGGCSGVCIVPRAMFGGATPRTVTVNTPLTFVLAGISTDLQAAEQQQDRKKAWLKPSNVHNKGKLNVSF